MTIEEKDIAEVVASGYMKKVQNSKILITGATGLIGSFLIKCLLKSENNIRVVAFVRNEEKAKRIFKDYLSSGNLSFMVGDICNIKDLDEDIDYIIHGASVTSSKMMVDMPVETIDIAIRGTKSILDASRKLKNLKGFLYLSSLEVYGVTDEKLESIKETDYGYIDELNIRSSYSLGKRMVECLAVSYEAEYNIPVKIVRLTQTFGSGVDYNDGRVFADFARCVIEKRNIILHTEGLTVRNYCYLCDAATALVTVLVDGKRKEAYNIANMETDISIRGMAEMLAKMYPESNSKVIIENNGDAAKMGYNPTIKVKLNTEKLQSLGWSASVGIEEMFSRLIEDMTANKK